MANEIINFSSVLLIFKLCTIIWMILLDIIDVYHRICLFLYVEMSKHNYLGVVTGLLSPTRHFVEQMAVAEQWALPLQSGFTQSYSKYLSVYSIYFDMCFAIDLATVRGQSTAGWYWPFARLFMVGLTVCLLSFLFLHMFNWPQHSQKPLIVSFQEKKNKKKYLRTLTRID